LHNLHESGLELRFHAKKFIFNSESDYLKDYQEVNGQAMMRKSPLENPLIIK